jgi:hypothetical protein
MGTATHLDPEVTVALQGTLDTFALPDVLRLLAATKKTGRLCLTGPRGTGSVQVGGGGIGAIEAPHAAHATEPVEVLFELLRFDEGSFTFDAAAESDAAETSGDLEALLAGAEALLVEWREIESVVPSMDAWVTLRRALVTPQVSIERSHWQTIVAVGSGATVRAMSDDLSLSELPISRAVRDLAELGLIDIDVAAPAEPVPANALRRTPQPVAAPAIVEDVTANATAPTDESRPEPEREAASDAAPDADAPLPTARPLRARRPKSTPPPTSSEPETFVPLELPGQGRPASYDPIEAEPESAADALADVDELAAAFPGLANRVADGTSEDEELARQLAMLSPRAAEAVRAAAEATTDEARDLALAEVDEDEGQPINRGLLLKFLSSVKS